MDLKAIQSALRERKFDAWLFYDHHHRDPIAYRVLGLADSLMVTRRWYYVIPAEGEPQKVNHRIESHHLDTLPGTKHEYSSWQEQHEALKKALGTAKTIAMEYSPNNTIPLIGLVDAGTVELVRSFGKEVVSSADLVTLFEATWQRLTLAQRAALRAAVLEEGRELLSGDVRTRYRLGGPSTVQASLNALVREDVLARDGSKYVVVDSLLREWVARHTY